MTRFSPRLTRRSFLAGFSALPFMPAAKALAALPVNPGIVVVGGGIAGMAAARTLMDGGYDCIVLEAKPRLGGRAYTETETFGFPYDRGCAWIRSADINPLSDLVRGNHFQVVDDTKKETWIFMDGKEATDAEYDKIGESMRAMSEKIDYGQEYYERHRKDVSLRDLAPPATRYDVIAHNTVGQLVTGSDTTRVSLFDVYQKTDTGTEWMIPDGMGYAMQRSLDADRIPVSLNTPVRSVTWYNADVVVDTPLGSIMTKGVVVTVPPVLLAEQRIRFDPFLPSWKTEAINALPAGLLDKVALTFQPGFLQNIPQGTSVLIQNGEKGPVWEFQMRPFGHDMAVGFIGGRGAGVLRQQGAEAAKRAALGALMSAFGPGIKDAVKAWQYSDWGNDPWARGSFSVQKVGFLSSREDIGKPIAQRLYFAGEACSLEWGGSATAAYLSGIRAAQEVMRWIKL